MGERKYIGNLGKTYDESGQSFKAIKDYEEALIISRGIDDQRNEGTCFGNIGLLTAN